MRSTLTFLAPNYARGDGNLRGSKSKEIFSFPVLQNRFWKLLVKGGPKDQGRKDHSNQVWFKQVSMEEEMKH